MSVIVDVQKGLQLVLYSCIYKNRSQWPRSLRRGFADARLLRMWFRIPPGAWMSFSCECCVQSGRGICVGLITRPEESYMSVLCPTYHEREASIMWRPWPSRGCCGMGNKNVFQLKMLLQIVPRRFTSYKSFSGGAGRSSETLEGVRRTRVLENSTQLTVLWKAAVGYVENSKRR